MRSLNRNWRKHEMNRVQVGEIAKSVVYWQPIRIFTLHYGNRRPHGLLPLSRLSCALDEFPVKASRGIPSWECVQRTSSSATNRKKFCFKKRNHASIVYVIWTREWSKILLCEAITSFHDTRRYFILISEFVSIDS